MLLFHLSCVAAKNQSVILVNIDNHPLKLVYQTWVRSDLNEQGEWKSLDGTFDCREQDATDAIIVESSDDQMPANFFERYPGVESIEMTHKHLKTIASTDLQNANYLRRINVSHNEIDNIAALAFDAAPKLTEIDLSYNLLHDLNENIFTSYLIKYLYLHNNQLTVVQSAWFENLLYLRVLTLNNNRIRAIDCGQLFDFIPNINVLHLHSNEIADVRNLPNAQQQQSNTPRSMQTFSLYNNPVAVTSHHLIWLNAGTVDVRNTSTEICRISQRMHTLHAANNKIREINLDSLSEPNENSLVTLNLANNRMESMENVTYFHRLQYLNLSQNLLAHIDAHIFDTLNNLLTLDLSHNKFGRFDVPNNRMPSLMRLDVSFNEILTLNVDGIVSQLETLNIDGNRIKADLMAMKKKRNTVNHEAQCLSDSTGDGECHSADDQEQRRNIRSQSKQPQISDDIRDFIYEQFHIMEKNILQLIDAKFTNIDRRIRRLDQEMIIITSDRPDNERD